MTSTEKLPNDRAGLLLLHMAMQDNVEGQAMVARMSESPADAYLSAIWHAAHELKRRDCSTAHASFLDRLAMEYARIDAALEDS